MNARHAGSEAKRSIASWRSAGRVAPSKHHRRRGRRAPRRARRSPRGARRTPRPCGEAGLELVAEQGDRARHLEQAGRVAQARDRVAAGVLEDLEHVGVVTGASAARISASAGVASSSSSAARVGLDRRRRDGERRQVRRDLARSVRRRYTSRSSSFSSAQVAVRDRRRRPTASASARGSGGRSPAAVSSVTPNALRCVWSSRAQPFGADRSGSSPRQ